MSSLAHQFVKLLTGAAAFCGDAHHGGTTVNLCAAYALHQSARLQFFENARHRTGSDPRASSEVGDASAFLLDERSQDGALALAQSFAADFVRTNLPEYAGEPFEFVPPLLHYCIGAVFVHGERIGNIIACVKQISGRLRTEL